MKQVNITLTVLCLFVFEPGLFSQEIYSTKDSTITYEFSSEADSVLKWMDLTSILDSTARYRTVSKFEWSTESESWIPVFRDSMIIDWSGLHKTEFVRSWDAGDNEWMPETRTENSYLDSLGKITLNEGWSWDLQMEQWVGEFRNEYEFDDHGNQILCMSCDWVAETEIWECCPYEKRDLIYNAYGYVVNESRSRWVDDNWMNRRKYEYDIDTLGRAVKRNSFKWNLDLSQWDPDNKVEWFYDDLGRDTLLQIYLWVSDPGYWYLDYFNRSVFNPPGRLIRTEIWHKGQVDADWQCQRYDHYYNAHGARERTHIFLKYPRSEIFKLFRTVQLYPGAQHRTLYEAICNGDSLWWQEKYYMEPCKLTERFTAVTGVDSIHSLDLSVHERPEAFAILDISGQEEHCEGETIWYVVPENDGVTYTWYSDHGEILSGQNNDTLELQWISSQGEPELLCWAETQHGCVSDTAVLQVQLMICDGVEERPLAGMVLYPVPVQEVLQVQCDLDFLEIEVVDLSGREVATAKGTFIDLSNLHAGAYVVRLKDRDGTLIGTRKIIKE